MGTRQVKRSVALLAALFAGFLTAGCGQGGTPDAGGSSVSTEPSQSPSSSSPSSSSPSSSPLPSGPASGGAPGGKQSAAADEMTVSGRVEEGVEAGCIMLRTNTQLYQLLGGDRNVVKVGNNIVVRGRVAKGVMGFCMQGTPFEVSEARLA
jgi:hypothetical protein